MARSMSSSQKSPIVVVDLARALRAAANATVAFVRATWKARRHRREVIGLLHFDDRALADIGLTRGDLHAVLATSLFEDPSTRLRVLAVERRAARRAAARENLAACSVAPVRPVPSRASV